jgi:hypothetical protein
MGKGTAAASTQQQARQREAFDAGVRCIDDKDYDGALQTFRALDEGAGFDDDFQNRYTSYHGLTRVLLGDDSGVKLCRKAAVGNDADPDVLCNLALAEHRLHNRERAYLALRRGLRVAPEHAGLLRLKQSFGLRRQHGILPLLSRNHGLNRWLGRLLRGMRRPGGE